MTERVSNPTARRRPIAFTLLAIAAAAAFAGCSGGSNEQSSACGPVKRESLDPRSLQHVLPNAPLPSYLTDPPTSGPHQPTPPIVGLRTEPIPAVQQVGLLESGKVVVQYVGLREADVQRLADLVTDDVVVAPAQSLPGGSAVVVTAWLHKQTCSSVDVTAIRSFVRTQAGHGPGASS